MASTGTVGAPEVDFRFRPRARETVMVAGRMKIHGLSVIEAVDLKLRTIKSFVGQVYANPKSGGAGGTFWGPITLQGSIYPTVGSLNNQISLRPLVGSIYGATFHLGTKTAGTVKLSYFAVGI